MKFKLRVDSILEFGQRKDSEGNPHQEDSIYPEYGRQSAQDRLFILCDGMGGHEAGEVASSAVCKAMSRNILEECDPEGSFNSSDFLRALEVAYNALDDNDNGSPKTMGTTLAFLKFHEKGAFIAHIGDSRVYHIRPGKTGNDTLILHETFDHSLLNQLVKMGEMTKEEAMESGQRNVITRAMQPHLGHRPKADIYETKDIKGGDYFYLCSDGMLENPDMENGDTIKNVFSLEGGDFEEKVKTLRQATLQNRDNHSAFIILIQGISEKKCSFGSMLKRVLGLKF